MHFEGGGIVDAWAMSDADIDRQIEASVKRPLADLQFGEEHLLNLKVAEQMGKGATIEDARALPLITWAELLILRLALIEAEPEIQRRAQEEAETRAREKEQAKPTGR